MKELIPLIFGTVLAIAGIVLLFLKRENGQNRIKFFGQEFQLSTPALVVFLVGCAIFIMPFFIAKPVQPTQHWLNIHRVAVHNMEAHEGILVNIVARVNGVIYSYPADVPYTPIGVNMAEQKMPLPIDTDSYRVSFEAYIKKPDAESVAIARSRETPVYKEEQLPTENQSYDLHAVVNDAKVPEVTMTVKYSIE